MLPASVALILGLVVLVYSAGRFVEGAAAAARHWQVPPLLIGIVVIGFGTSLPEMLVSALASLQGSPGVALGNAYGSNIINIALVLGLAAVLCPLVLHSGVLRKELPILTAVTALAAWQLWDGTLSRVDAIVLLLVFAAVMSWSIVQGLRERNDALAADVERDLSAHPMSLARALVSVAIGLLLLVVSSRALVWGAVEIATVLGVSDLIIGLTIVAVGTSLPELAAAVVAARKGEPDLVVGNVLGSNLFNTLAVVGIAGAIHPLQTDPQLLSRDVLVMAVLTVSLFVIGYGMRPGRITRVEGGALLAAYVGYTGWLVISVL
jgi:cation:H+ antiporter